MQFVSSFSITIRVRFWTYARHKGFSTSLRHLSFLLVLLSFLPSVIESSVAYLPHSSVCWWLMCQWCSSDVPVIRKHNWNVELAWKLPLNKSEINCTPRLGFFKERLFKFSVSCMLLFVFIYIFVYNMYCMFSHISITMRIFSIT